MAKIMQMLEQVDVTAGKPHIYSWLLCGVPGSAGKARRRLEDDGWHWVRGPEGGCYCTNDGETARAAALRLGLSIVSNGTHAVHGVGGFLVCVPVMMWTDANLSHTGRDAAATFARDYFTNNEREIESFDTFTGRFSLVHGNCVYQIKLSQTGYQVWKVVDGLIRQRLADETIRL
jgi:hypothetical protein